MRPEQPGACLALNNVSFSFGKTRAVDGVTLTVQPSSFTTLLGPSGCGKTTLLRLVSGFLSPDGGQVLIDGVDQAGIAPNVRQVGIVFQDYALFPQMTVRKNLGYGLRIQKVPAEQAEQAVSQVASMLGIESLLERHPHELSGGQQQRVALGRALVLRPRLLLMDEPLSSLDAKLRVRVREELREIQQELGITTLYVTHDQEEALSLSDRVAVLRDGSLQQEGTPQDVYYRPRSRFVADFCGRANFLSLGGSTCLVRPEWLSFSQGGGCDVGGTFFSAEFLGSSVRYKVLCDKAEGGVLYMDVPSAESHALPQKGDAVHMDILRKFVLAPGQ